jgi:hypothetical protein
MSTAQQAYSIDDVMFFDEQIHFRADDEAFPAGPGENSGRLLLELDVDGEFTFITVDAGRTGHLQLLAAAMSKLEQLHASLSVMYPGGERGQCLVRGDWGRCQSDHDHDGSHAFPTEEEVRTTWAVLANAKKVAAARQSRP